jgi:hypothetical protein
VCTNGTLVEDQMRRFKGECAHFSFNNCSVYTHVGASAKFSINSHETDNSVGVFKKYAAASLKDSWAAWLLTAWINEHLLFAQRLGDCALCKWATVKQDDWVNSSCWVGGSCAFSIFFSTICTA